ncbi:hypothetical protein NL676_031921 [Syzygium grande]|nr:hypothetical protein NL676_031921 [Syzygium grande]
MPPNLAFGDINGDRELEGEKWREWLSLMEAAAMTATLDEADQRLRYKIESKTSRFGMTLTKPPTKSAIPQIAPNF